ncbi:hypothetical protein OIU76_028332 [Salix suchowensis]|nr:hypothetical protein OIU76_028332 [Salix suchowensis]
MLEEFPEEVEEVEAKRLKYTFTTLSKDDTSSMRGRGREDAFGTSDKAEAGRRARALGMEMEWLPGGGVEDNIGSWIINGSVWWKKREENVVQHSCRHAWKGNQLSYVGRWNKDTRNFCEKV